MTVNKILCECFDCEKEVEIDDAYLYCDDCNSKRGEHITSEVIIYAAEEAITEDKWLWEDEESLEGFSTEQEKRLYMGGIKYGFKMALMSICDNLGINFDSDKHRQIK